MVSGWVRQGQRARRAARGERGVDGVWSAAHSQRGVAFRMRFHGVLSAAALLTRVPVPRGTHTGDLRVAAPWMPVIGAGIGGVSAIACIAFQRLGSGVAAVAAVSTSIILTGCLHEDGLADTADALGGAGTRERLFEILKDSRVGAFGAVAIALSLMWRTLLIDRLGQDAGGGSVVPRTFGGSRGGGGWGSWG